MIHSPPASTTEYRRAGLFTCLLLLINAVADGFSGRPIGVAHQLILLPLTLAFLYSFYCVAFTSASPAQPIWNPGRALKLAFCFQLASLAIFAFEGKHFARLGYHLDPWLLCLGLAFNLPLLVALLTKKEADGKWIFAFAAVTYAFGVLLAIRSFPLTYLRSDMLPVIQWADTNLLHHTSPYQTMYVGGRVYDFPYLPGMLVAYLPAVAAHTDLRFACLFYVLATAALIFLAARRDRRREVAALLGLFLLCPYLQYRHDLYNQPHWLTLAAIFVLMQRRRYAWAALVFGASMAIYQFSWILFPFFLLNALRRRGWLEAAKLAALSALGALLIAGPFLSSALRRIGSNTVGQWGALATHALAEPMNLSYWATYIVRPGQLLRLQAVLMIAIFVYCFLAGRCRTLVDTLRWMLVALILFILLNVLVDGYFFLMLLVPLLIYTCVANGWWAEPKVHPPDPRRST